MNNAHVPCSWVRVAFPSLIAEMTTPIVLTSLGIFQLPDREWRLSALTPPASYEYDIANGKIK